MIDRPRQPTLDTLPDVLPVFPLPGALLFPGGQLPLNIFEPRYLNMIEDAMDAARLIGMIQPSEPSTDHLVADGIGLYATGCVGQINQFHATEDGRYVITLDGIVRFRVREEAPGVDGYRRVYADYTRYGDDFASDQPDAEKPISNREELFDAMRIYFDQQGIEADMEALEQAPDHLLVTTLAMSCPFDVNEKQALLECNDDCERSELLTSMFKIAAFHSGTNTTDIRQ